MVHIGYLSFVLVQHLLVLPALHELEYGFARAGEVQALVVLARRHY